MRNKWTEQEKIILKENYKSYPFILNNELVLSHGKSGCYSQAKKMGLSHRLHNGVPDISRWPNTTLAYLAGIIDGEGTIYPI